MSDRETRCYSGEVRAEQQGEQPTRIIGYGSVFNSRSEPLWGFREIIKPGAFDDVLGDDIRGLFNHDPNFILGRSSSGTLNVNVDDKGLRYDIAAPDTQTIRDLVLAPMMRGDINQSSFAFRVAHDGENWYQDDEGIVIREINRFSRLFDGGNAAWLSGYLYSNMVKAVRLGPVALSGGLWRDFQLGGGQVVTGFHTDGSWEMEGGDDKVYYRPIQYLVGDTWVTAPSV
ncbi:HK97 family phage prohead protease [Salmonella enterica subsp. enterica]|nr:HK97 family phage prohead protease [Salmonella enterica subsp. enterica]